MSKPKACAKCDQTVYPLDLVRALDLDWHKGCFRCAECNTTLSLQNYFSSLSAVDGKKQPFCRVHRPSAAAPAAASSAPPSSKPAAKAGSTKFLGGIATKPETPCPVCSKAVYATERIRALRNNYHRACFRCVTCGLALNVKSFQSADNQLYCIVHLPKVVQGLGLVSAAASSVGYRGPLKSPSASPSGKAGEAGAGLSPSRKLEQAMHGRAGARTTGSAAGPGAVRPPGSIGRARAHTAWAAQDETELSLAVGDEIVVMSKDNEDWYTGALKGVTLLFPITHATMEEEWPRVEGRIGIALVRGERDYEAAEEGELSFAEGQVFPVLSYDNEEWWTGKIGEAQGLFPAMYVSVVETYGPALVEAASSDVLGTAVAHTAWAAQDETEISLAPGDRLAVHSFDNDDWWTGTAPSGARGLFPVMCVDLLASTPAAAATSAGASREQVRALYDYVAADTDELSFSAGDLIDVFVKTSDTWWSGACRGREGLFPLSHVEAFAASAGTTYRALYDHPAGGDDEITFKAGDSVLVLSKDNDEWWTGIAHGRQGLLQCVYLDRSNE